MQEIAVRVAGTDEIAELYRANAEQLRQIVRFSVRAPEAVIDDACQIAWSRLVGHRAGVRSETALPWLVTTAGREALKLRTCKAARRPCTRRSKRSCDGSARAPGRARAIVQLRDRLAQLRTLPQRQQRLVWLQGLGLSYAEMAVYTGDSQRTIERQILRAKRALRSPRVSGGRVRAPAALAPPALRRAEFARLGRRLGARAAHARRCRRLRWPLSRAPVGGRRTR